MLDLALVALVLLPALVGSGLLVVGPPADRIAVPAGVVTAVLLSVAAAVVAFPTEGSRPSVATPFMAGSDLALAVDGLAAPTLLTVALVSLLVLLSSTGNDSLRTGRFHGLMLLFVAAVVMTVVSSTLPTLLLAWEVMGATSFALIGYHWRDPVNLASGTTAFLTTRTADLGLYVAAGAALAGGSGFELAALTDSSHGWRNLLAAGVLVAGLGKAAQVPFSFWLSRAMHGPSPVSALLHSAAMVAMGGYLLLRMSPALAATGWADDVAAWAGAVTALLLGLVALFQGDLKQLLAASTAAQLGYVVLAAGVGATAAGTTHLVAHAAVKAGLFLAAGLWLQALGTKRLSGLAGAARRWPVVGACSVAGLLSLAGLPPFALWVTKDAVLAAAWEHSPLLYVTGLTGAGLAAAYAGKALVVLTRTAPAGVESQWDEERSGTREVARGSSLPLVPLAAAALVLGVLALPPLAERMRELAGGQAPAPGVVELLVSAAVAGAAFAITLAVTREAGSAAASRRRPVVLVHWLFLERVALRVVVYPMVRLADVLARVDDAVVDRGVVAAARWTVRAAGVAARADDDAVDATVHGVASTARSLGRFVQRPQTGQLHQYYLQALFVLGLAVLVLVVVR